MPEIVPPKPSFRQRPLTRGIVALLVLMVLGGGYLWWSQARTQTVVVTEIAAIGPVTPSLPSMARSRPSPGRG